MRSSQDTEGYIVRPRRPGDQGERRDGAAGQCVGAGGEVRELAGGGGGDDGVAR